MRFLPLVEFLQLIKHTGGIGQCVALAFGAVEDKLDLLVRVSSPLQV